MEEALLHIAPGDVVVDVGTGSGAIAVTLALESQARVVIGTDVSRDALGVACRNRQGARSVVFVQCDLLSAVRRADVVVSNPPYIAEAEADSLAPEVREHEPPLALFAAEDGLAIYRALVADSARVLRPGGWLVVELGWRSLDPVQAMLGREWSEVRARPDLAGIPRVLSAQWTP